MRAPTMEVVMVMVAKCWRSGGSADAHGGDADSCNNHFGDFRFTGLSLENIIYLRRLVWIIFKKNPF